MGLIDGKETLTLEEHRVERGEREEGKEGPLHLAYLVSWACLTLPSSKSNRYSLSSCLHTRNTVNQSLLTMTYKYGHVRML